MGDGPGDANRCDQCGNNHFACRCPQCEFCEQFAVWRMYKREYQRFACGEHVAKVRRLIRLDHGSMDGFTTIETVQAGVNSTNRAYQRPAQKDGK